MEFRALGACISLGFLESLLNQSAQLSSNDSLIINIIYNKKGNTKIDLKDGENMKMRF